MILITCYLYFFISLTDALDRLVPLPFAILTLNIDTPIYEILKISYVRSGRLWVIDSYDGDLIQVDTDGNLKDEVDSNGQFCVTKDDALLYTSIKFEDDEDDEDDEYDLCIKKKTSQETVTLLKTEKYEKVCDIHSSAINGHILVLFNVRVPTFPPLYLFKITRYSENGVKIQDIKVDDLGTRWLYQRNGFTENRNGDIILSNDKLDSVVGMDSSGGRRFTYSNPDDFTTMDICTDKYRHILVAYDTCIHLLDEDGTFKKTLLTNSRRHNLTCLCLDDKQNLYVGTDLGIVKVYKYLKDD